ncbi:MAG: TlpA family protein disulfide reductase [Spirochaetes bacterium]|nr:TlpA family protein disulfide reductase [Spirochaetota bacterium]
MKSMQTGLIILLLLSLVPAHTAYRKAPNFALAASSGRMVFKSSIKGNILISFFASYCRPCKRELPDVVGLGKKYRREKNLTLLLISADINDSSGSAKKKASDFLKKIGISEEFILDIYHVALEKYNSSKVLPATFLVNSDGYIVFSEVGAHEDTIARLEKAITGLRGPAAQH